MRGVLIMQNYVIKVQGIPSSIDDAFLFGISCPFFNSRSLVFPTPARWFVYPSPFFSSFFPPLNTIFLVYFYQLLLKLHFLFFFSSYLLCIFHTQTLRSLVSKLKVWPSSNTTYELWCCECLVYAWWPVATPGFGCGYNFPKLFFLLRVSLLPLNDVFIDVDTEKLNDVLSSSKHA